MRSPLAPLTFIGCIVLFPKAALGRKAPLYVYRSPPTFSPTAFPSFQPSARPTSLPTSSPSILPSYQPSYQPTITPTLSLDPTINVKPTFEPTLSHSYQPSTTPSSIISSSFMTSEAMEKPFTFGLWLVITLIAIVVCFVGAGFGWFRSRRSKRKSHPLEERDQNTQDDELEYNTKDIMDEVKQNKVLPPAEGNEDGWSEARSPVYAVGGMFSQFVPGLNGFLPSDESLVEQVTTLPLFNCSGTYAEELPTETPHSEPHCLGGDMDSKNGVKEDRHPGQRKRSKHRIKSIGRMKKTDRKGSPSPQDLSGPSKSPPCDKGESSVDKNHVNNVPRGPFAGELAQKKVEKVDKPGSEIDDAASVSSLFSHKSSASLLRRKMKNIVEIPSKQSGDSCSSVANAIAEKGAGPSKSNDERQERAQHQGRGKQELSTIADEVKEPKLERNSNPASSLGDSSVTFYPVSNGRGASPTPHTRQGGPSQQEGLGKHIVQLQTPYKMTKQVSAESFTSMTPVVKIMSASAPKCADVKALPSATPPTRKEHNNYVNGAGERDDGSKIKEHRHRDRKQKGRDDSSKEIQKDSSRTAGLDRVDERKTQNLSDHKKPNPDGGRNNSNEGKRFGRFDLFKSDDNASCSSSSSEESGKAVAAQWGWLTNSYPQERSTGVSVASASTRSTDVIVSIAESASSDSGASSTTSEGNISISGSSSAGDSASTSSSSSSDEDD